MGFMIQYKAGDAIVYIGAPGDKRCGDPTCDCHKLELGKVYRARQMIAPPGEEVAVELEEFRDTCFLAKLFKPVEKADDAFIAKIKSIVRHRETVDA
jgi:hypothetical protein